MAEFAGRDGTGAVSQGGELENTGVGAETMEGAESEQEGEEDVYEVESILDSKIEGGEVLYRIRWKGYKPDEDTWEPEANLDYCKEVLLEFRRKQAESKQKAAKKETLPKLSDLFDAETDSDSPQSTKDESGQKKKKKSKEEEDKKLQEDLKKKSKSGKNKEKSKAEAEPSENQLVDSKPKKRLSESSEDLSSKKPKKEDGKKSKKEDNKDGKVKAKEEHKEKKNKKAAELEPTDRQESPEPQPNAAGISSDVFVDERDKLGQEETVKGQEMVVDAPEEPALIGTMDVETDDMKLKKKKKKHKKKAEKDDDMKAMFIDEPHVDKKSLLKKQKSVDKLKELIMAEKLSAPIPKSSRPSSEEKTRKSVDSFSENKEAKKSELSKEKPKKKHDAEKDARKEAKVIKSSKEPKAVHDAFTISAEDREECMESTKKDESPLDYRLPEDYKMKEIKSNFKDRRSTQDEADSWTFGAPEGDQEVMDTMCHPQDSSGALDSRPQLMGVGMDLQLEWMTLEDFQRHLDGSDEIIPKDPISNIALKEAVKNGDYLTVKYALNSKEQYNLDQEDASGMTLVMMAAAAGQDDILRLLIKKGAKLNAKQRNGTTALIHATEKNHLTTVALLLEAGAFVNLQQVTGETALMKACKKGNIDTVRLLIEHGADSNILTKHQNNALQFAKQSDNMVFELLNGHLQKLSRVVEDAIKDYFESRLGVLEPIFSIACHRLCEGPDFSLDFNYKPPFNIPEESGILLFVFHANFFGMEVVVRLCGPCSVQAVVLNDKFQLPVFLDANFIYSFSPVTGANKLFIRLSEVPNAKVKLLICAYRVQPH